jgi:hypothetical protein
MKIPLLDDAIMNTGRVRKADNKRKYGSFVLQVSTAFPPEAEQLETYVC